jgi:broad specificity phosphatase PhoE
VVPIFLYFTRIYSLNIVNLPPVLSQDELHTWCHGAINKIAKRFSNETIIIITHAAPLIALARGLLGPTALVRAGVCSVTKLVYNLDGDSSATQTLIAANNGGENGKKERWFVEVNGSCSHLRDGEQYHWTFPQ